MPQIETDINESETGRLKMSNSGKESYDHVICTTGWSSLTIHSKYSSYEYQCFFRAGETGSFNLPS